MSETDEEEGERKRDVLAHRVHIQETFGPILGMDQMCNGTVPGDLHVGDRLVRNVTGAEPVVATVGALQAIRAPDGTLNELTGIGLRGPDAHLIQPGDLLVVEPAAGADSP